MIRNDRRARRIPSDRRLVALAVEPTGDGPYVEAMQELIEQVVPRPAALWRGTPALGLAR